MLTVSKTPNPAEMFYLPLKEGEEAHWEVFITVYTYLKGAIVCEYYFFAIFVTGGKNAKLSTRNYSIQLC